MSVLFVERTPNGELCRALRLAEQDMRKSLKRRVRIVERAGTKMSSQLTKSDLWQDYCPEPEKCLICPRNCVSGNKTACRKRNIMYSTTCQLWNSGDKDTRYFGESRRSGTERLTEHMRDLDRQKKDSHMYTHILNEHPELSNKEDRRQNFTMKIEKTFTRPMDRQIN